MCSENRYAFETPSSLGLQIMSNFLRWDHKVHFRHKSLNKIKWSTGLILKYKMFVNSYNGFSPTPFFIKFYSGNNITVYVFIFVKSILQNNTNPVGFYIFSYLFLFTEKVSGQLSQ